MPMSLDKVIEVNKPGELLFAWSIAHNVKPIRALMGCRQDPAHHPEGDVFNHSRHVTNAMAKICQQEGVTGDDRSTLILAAILHDVGKPKTTKWNTEKQRWTSYCHDEVGEEIAGEFLRTYCQDFLGNFEENLLRVCNLVRRHMVRCQKDFRKSNVRRLARKLFPATIRDLVLLMRADSAGRPPFKDELPKGITEGLIPIAKDLGIFDVGVSPVDHNQHARKSPNGNQLFEQQSASVEAPGD